MEKLGVNTIRVYHVEADANHDGCMEAFASAGIYAMIDMDTFTTYILPVRFKSGVLIGGSNENDG